MATEKIEPPPKMRSPVKKPAVEKTVKQKPKGVRVKGRVSTPERKPVRKEPLPIPKEDARKKKGFLPHTWLHVASCCAVCLVFVFWLGLFISKAYICVHQSRVCFCDVYDLFDFFPQMWTQCHNCTIQCSFLICHITCSLTHSKILHYYI